MIHKTFERLNRINGQWLVTWTLVAFLATVILMYILSFLGRPLMEKTGSRLVDLQLAGALVITKGTREVESAAKSILDGWKNAGLLNNAVISQQFDFLFPLAYGSFSLLLSVGMWRCHKKYPIGGKWVWCLAFGTVAAVLDELENILIWQMLSGSIEPGWIWPVLASSFAIPKFVCLAIAAGTFFLALRRVRP